MSHIHIPDGVLPLWLWGAGWLATIVLVGLAVIMSRGQELQRKVPLVGVVSAFVLVSMSSEIVPIAYHMNLTVVAGVLLGPWLGIIAAIIVQVILAAIGHGGVTVIGLNTVMMSVEVMLGWALFTAFVKLLGRGRAGLAGAASTVLTLATATALLVGLVALAGGGVASVREAGALDPGTLRFENPFSEGVFSVKTLEREVPASAAEVTDPGLGVKRFALVVFVLGPVGWLLEALVTGIILGFVARVRPALVFSGALGEGRRARPARHEEGEP